MKTTIRITLAAALLAGAACSEERTGTPAAPAPTTQSPTGVPPTAQPAPQPAPAQQAPAQQAPAQQAPAPQAPAQAPPAQPPAAEPGAQPPAAAQPPAPSGPGVPQPPTSPASTAQTPTGDVPQPSGTPDAARGEPLYVSYCSSCHGPKGEGDGPAAAALQPRPAKHSDGAYMNALSNAHLFKVIEQGGQAVGKSPLMAPWGGTLSDDQIWDVVAYVRSLARPPYTQSVP
jgi:mono/diheme cytochrome c family protein